MEILQRTIEYASAAWSELVGFCGRHTEGMVALLLVWVFLLTLRRRK